MKRQIEKLSEIDICDIKFWLDFHSDKHKANTCPFNSSISKPKCRKCKHIFPKLNLCAVMYNEITKERFWSYMCPCNTYSLAYVKRIARQVVKDYEKQ